METDPGPTNPNSLSSQNTWSPENLHFSLISIADCYSQSGLLFAVIIRPAAGRLRLRPRPSPRVGRTGPSRYVAVRRGTTRSCMHC